jgi:hypothetical protein
MADYDMGDLLVGPGGAGGNFGTMTPQEAALAVTPGSVLDAMARRAASLPARITEQSERLRTTGEYDPGPMVEAMPYLYGAGTAFAPETALGSGGARLATTPAPDVLLERQRTAYPGIYQSPRALAEQAAARVAPEDPALQQLFGVSRQDLYDISQAGTRPGNIEPQLALPGPRSRGSYVAQNITTPQNAQRLIDVLSEAERRAPQLTQPMDAWYVMDPLYQRVARVVGAENAPAAYTKLNTLTAMASPGSPVPTEITRGTAAHMMAMQGRFPEFVQYGGKPGAVPELADVPGHPYHSTSQAGPMARYLETGQVEMGSPKVPTYIAASGVPETGFQANWPVPDAHFTRAVGAADVRRGTTDIGGSMQMPEYAGTAPWFREQVASPLGIQSVPAQARAWGVYAPQTGVESPIGAGKLELLAGNISRRAQKLGIDPNELLDRVILGTAHAAVGGLTLGGVLDAVSKEQQ